MLYHLAVLTPRLMNYIINNKTCARSKQQAAGTGAGAEAGTEAGARAGAGFYLMKYQII